MAVSFRDSAQAAAFPGPSPLVIPATVHPGDTCLVFATVGAPASTLGVTSSGPTVPAQVDLSSGSATVFALYQFAARIGDPGATLTFSASAGGAPVVGLLLAYAGAGLLQAGDWQRFTAAASLTTVSPQFAPAAAGSWGIAFGGNNSGSPPTYAPGTFRRADAFAVTAAYDSAAPASPVGGGTWTNGASDVWWGYTVALRPAAAGHQRPAAAWRIRPGALFPGGR